MMIGLSKYEGRYLMIVAAKYASKYRHVLLQTRKCSLTLQDYTARLCLTRRRTASWPSTQPS